MTRVTKHDFPVVAALCLAFTFFGSAIRVAADEDDPPSRVARLSYEQGSVSFQPAGTDDWVSPGLNRPVTTGDKLWSDRDGRIELQLDGSVIRASNSTGFSFLNLGDNVTQIEVTAGTVLVRVQRLDDRETYEVDTPNLAFSFLRPGLYRVSVNEAGDSTAIRVRDGQGEVTGGGAAYAVRANESVVFTGLDQLSARPDSYGSEDAFDNWAADRDRRWEHSAAAQYVSPDVIGYQDLDAYGSWRGTPDGQVWFPRTSPGWAPYREGHWAYVGPWGYTWVDDQPWGFAPFHYGRWAYYQGSWGWVPAPPRALGVVYVRPVYAPALVAWVGGPHFGVTVGAGGFAPGVNVGWFPLGPREVYVPSYRATRAYVNNVNVSNTAVNVTVVNNYYNNTVVNNGVNAANVRYANQAVAGAVTVTTPQAFTGAQPVARQALRVDPREIAAAPARAQTPAVVPARQAVLGPGAAAPKPPAAVQTRPVVAKVAPPPPPPSFEKGQDAIRSNGGKPLSLGQVRSIEPASAHREAPVRVAPPAKPAQPAAAEHAPAVRDVPQAVPPPSPPSVARPDQPPVRPDQRTDRPPTPNNANSNAHQVERPAVVQPPTPRADRPQERPALPNSAPPTPRNIPAPAPIVHPNQIPAPAPPPVPPPSANPALERKQQQQDQLRARQDQERQNVQRQQEQQHAKLAQQQADEARKQQVERQHAQQTQQLQQKQTEERQHLRVQQQQERDKQTKSQNQKKNDRPSDGKSQ